MGLNSEGIGQMNTQDDEVTDQNIDSPIKINKSLDEKKVIICKKMPKQ